MNSHKLIVEMEKSGDLTLVARQSDGVTSKKPISTREPDLSPFSAEELSIVDEFMHSCWKISPRSMSKMSHRFEGWRTAAPHEVIPYCAALKGDRDVSREAFDIARSLVA